jgi:hypothetical protein
MTPAAWPQLVRTVVSLLPPRSDYVLQRAYSLCPADDGEVNATVGIGAHREHGDLDISLEIHGYLRADCTAAAEQIVGPGNAVDSVAFCSGGGRTRLIFGVHYGDGMLAVWVVYPNGHQVDLAWAPTTPNSGQATAVTLEQLRQAATSPELYNLIPDHGPPPASPSPVPAKS